MPPPGEHESSTSLLAGAAAERIPSEVLRLMQRTGPQRMDDAVTDPDMLRGGDLPLPSRVRWIYYEKPVRHYLSGLGCAAQDLDDLTHEILIRLQSVIVDKYDPARPFRPYFKAAIRNCYFKHLRRRNRDAARLDAEPEAPAADEPGEALLQVLPEYARDVYERFTESAEPHLLPGVRMLHGWIILGAKQESLAHAWGLTTRQVRTHIARAADALANWMQARINSDDLDDLVRLAHLQGVSVDLGLANVRGLFSHLSKRKRIRVLLILAIIYKKMNPGTDGASGDR